MFKQTTLFPGAITSLSPSEDLAFTLLFSLLCTMMFKSLDFFTELTTLRANTFIMKTLEEEVTGLNTKKDELNEHIITLETGIARVLQFS